MTRIKICGLTREADVRLAVDLGAWACGFVLSDSPRRVSVERARRLAEEAAGALTVGVVTTETAVWIADAAALAGFDGVQLSAGADGPSVAVVRAAAMRCGLRPLIIAAADTTDAAAADFVLLDTREPGRYGGTGRMLDWKALAGSVTSDRLVLAGGLTPQNVATAVATLRPFAVDVSGGVEHAAGRKDERRVRQFFAAVIAADASLGDAGKPGGDSMVSGRSADPPHTVAPEHHPLPEAAP